MISALIGSQLRKNRDLIVGEAKEMEAFMQLLMKQRNTGLRWSKPEKAELKHYLRSMVCIIPALCIFLLPGGLFLLPLLAEVMDRRKRPRKAA